MATAALLCTVAVDCLSALHETGSRLVSGACALVFWRVSLCIVDSQLSLLLDERISQFEGLFRCAATQSHTARAGSGMCGSDPRVPRASHGHSADTETEYTP